MAEGRQIKQIRATALLLASVCLIQTPSAPAENAAQSHAGTDSLQVMEPALAGEFALQAGRLAESARHYATAAQASRQTTLSDRAATIALYAKDYELAAEVARHWLDIEAGAIGALRTRAWAALAEGQLERGMPDLEALAQRGSIESQRALAQVLIAAENRTLAPEALHGLVSRDLILPLERGPVWSAIASNLGANDLALQLAAAETRARPRDAEAWRRRAQVELAAEREQEAAQSLERALALAPENFELRLALASLWAQAGASERADKLLEKATGDLDRSYAARIALQARDGDRRILGRIARQLRRADPDKLPSRAFLGGQVAELLEDVGAALAWYEQVPAGPTYHDAGLRRAVLMARNRAELQAARALLAHLRSVSSSPSERVDAFLLEAELLAEADRSAARPVYDQALSTLPGDARLLYARALYLVGEDDIDGAEADLRRILASDPDNAQALNALGYTLADRTDRHGEALGYIERALAQFPEDGAFVDSMGWVQYRLGNLPEALRYLRRAWELLPDGEVASHLVEVLWVSDQKDEALRLAREALQRWPDHGLLRDTLDRLGAELVP